MKYNFTIVKSASEIPQKWDDMALSLFQERKFLIHTEKFNPCKQRYYLLFDQQKLVAGACAYTRYIDLFAFINLKSPVKMKVIGLPFTCNLPGLIGNMQTVQLLLKEILRTERGMILGLNISPDLDCKPAISLRGAPSIVFHNRFFEWGDYLDSMKSSYRRRAKKILGYFEGIHMDESDCTCFSEEHYELYCQVFSKSKMKLEKLSLLFFKNLPQDFKLFKYSMEGKMIAWIILLDDGKHMHFYKCGMDYETIFQYKTYFNILFGIIQMGIGKGYKIIELGQTSETPKIGVGGNMEELHLFVFHRNPVIRLVFSIFGKAFQYTRRVPEAHVFKVR